MSESLRSEEDRRIAELEALVAGQAAEITRLEKELDKCEKRAMKLVLTLGKEKQRAEGSD